MNALRLAPVVLSALLIAAHYMRAGSLVWVLVSLAMPVLLFVRRPWVPHVLQVGLVLAASVWVMTAFELIRVRMTLGAPWTTAAIILGFVAAWTAGSAALFETKSLKRRYGRSLPGSA